MNREQRRKAAREGWTVGTVNLNEITHPWQMSDDEILQAYRRRIGDNLMHTKHPYHHLTASGAIVEPDPTLEYYRKRLAASRHSAIVAEYEQNVLAPHSAQMTDIPPAIPVDRTYYGHDLYAGR